MPCPPPHQFHRLRDAPPPYLADTGGTRVTTPTEHGPIRVPPAVEIASHCRGERGQLKVFGQRQLKKRGNKWVGSPRAFNTHPRYSTACSNRWSSASLPSIHALPCVGAALGQLTCHGCGLLAGEAALPRAQPPLFSGAGQLRAGHEGALHLPILEESPGTE